MQLRDYQRDVLSRASMALKKVRRIAIVMPTGAGKGVLAAWMLGTAASRGKRSLFVCHRKELLIQSSRKLTECGIEHGIINSDINPSALVQVATVQTIAKRGLPYRANLVIVDEVHHLPSSQWASALRDAGDFLVGLTATPERLDGKGLSEHIDQLVEGPGTWQLMEEGWLSKYDAYMSASIDRRKLRIIGGDYSRRAAAKRVIIGDVVKEWQNKIDGSSIAFCCTVEHAIEVSALFKSAGVDSDYIDGSMSDAEREVRMERLRSNGRYVLANCQILEEGVDVPEVRGVILLRPTASLALHLQQLGRSLRPKADGSRAVIMDHVGNCGEHGLPDERRCWSLDGRKAREADEGGEKAGGGKRKAPETVEGRLERVDPVVLARWRSDKRAAVMGARTIQELHTIVAAVGWKPGAAWHEARRRGWLRG